MKTYILIGGIGSGKSTVSDLFAQRGARCLDLDDVGHEVLLEQDIKTMLVEQFGDDILDSSGEIVRSALAAKAFSSPANTVRLNAITQPRLQQRAQEQLDAFEAEGCDLAIIEISAYDGPEGTFAPFGRKALGVIAVCAPTRVRVERAVAKGFDATDVKNRIARQVKDEQRALWADYVVNNKGTLDDLSAQVDEVWSAISA